MADEETKVTKPTRYFILRRNRRTGVIMPDGEREARGAEKAISDYLDEEVAEIGAHESVVAVPASNWTERGAKVQRVRSVEIVELAALSLLDDSDPIANPLAAVEDDGA